jgi:hypothetical protein
VIWRKHGVEMCDCDLSMFAEQLERWLLPPDHRLTGEAMSADGKDSYVHALEHRDIGSSHQG